MTRDEYDDETIVVRRGSLGIAPFLAGLAVGAAMALLFAPQSGAATRRQIRRGANRARRAVRDFAEETGERVADAYHDAREHIGEGTASARAALERRVDDARTAYESAIGGRKRRPVRGAAKDAGDR